MRKSTVFLAAFDAKLMFSLTPLLLKKERIALSLDETIAASRMVVSCVHMPPPPSPTVYIFCNVKNGGRELFDDDISARSIARVKKPGQ